MGGAEGGRQGVTEAPRLTVPSSYLGWGIGRNQARPVRRGGSISHCSPPSHWSFKSSQQFHAFRRPGHGVGKGSPLSPHGPSLVPPNTPSRVAQGRVRGHEARGPIPPCPPSSGHSKAAGSSVLPLPLPFHPPLTALRPHEKLTLERTSSLRCSPLEHHNLLFDQD